MAAARHARAPFTWGEVRAADPAAGTRIFAAAASFGWNDGLLVPVREDTGRIGMVSLAAPRLDGLGPMGLARIAAIATTAFQLALCVMAWLAAGPPEAGRIAAARPVPVEAQGMPDSLDRTVPVAAPPADMVGIGRDVVFVPLEDGSARLLDSRASFHALSRSGATLLRGALPRPAAPARRGVARPDCPAQPDGR